MSRDKKKELVKLLLSDGFSREAVGAFLGTTKNAIVGFQHTHLPELTGKSAGSKTVVDPARFEELIASNRDESLRETPSTEADTRTCQWPVGGGSLKHPNVCGAQCEAGEKLCPSHKAEVQRLNRRM